MNIYIYILSSDVDIAKTIADKFVCKSKKCCSDLQRLEDMGMRNYGNCKV